MLDGFTADAWGIVECAKDLAGREAARTLRVAHLVLALPLVQPDLWRDLAADAAVQPEPLATKAAELQATQPQGASLLTSMLPDGLIARWRQAASALATASPAQVTPPHLALGLWQWPDADVDALLATCALERGAMTTATARYLRAHGAQAAPQAAAAAAHGGGAQPQSQPADDILRDIRAFGEDLTASGRAGKLRPVVGREETTARMVKCLLHLDKKNVALLGPAGVGKTALVEDLALRIAQGQVPAELQETIVFSLDLTRLLAGANVYGMVEERVNALIETLRRHAGRIILFIDEMHAASTIRLTGSLDLTSALKPLLARGEIRCIGVTTRQEYASTIEQDDALARRFSTITLEEPSPDQTQEILKAVLPRYEAHYKMHYDPECLQAAVTLTGRYLPNRTFPDKALEVIDHAGAHVRARTDAGRPTPASITRADVAAAVSDLAHVPVSEELETTTHVQGELAALLNREVYGQDAAVEAVAQAVIRSASRYRDVRRPRCVMLFVGPSGVGKTLLAKSLAKALFQDAHAFLNLNMAQFKGGGLGYDEATAMLIGAPSGIVGWERGGVLTNFVLDRPFSVVLLDEVEKCGLAAQDLLLRIFDEGGIEDRLGNLVSFRDVYFVLTSNGAVDAVTRRGLGFQAEAPAPPTEDQLREILQEEVFRPEFVNRIERVVLFNDLTGAVQRQICGGLLDELKAQVAEKDRKLLSYSGDVVDILLRSCGKHIDGRAIERALKDLVLSPFEEARTSTPAEEWAAMTGISLALNPERDQLEVGPQVPRVRVLVIDDAASSFEDWGRRFSQHHWSHASSMEEALQHPLNPSPHLIVVDLLPDSDGATAAPEDQIQRLYALYPGSSITLLAGKDPAAGAAMLALLEGALPSLLERERSGIAHERDKRLMEYYRAAVETKQDTQHALLHLLYR